MSPVNAFYPNSTVRLAANFTANGVAADPTTVTCTVTDPDGGSYQATVVKDAVGAYHADYIPAAITGIWTYTFTGSGAVVATTQDLFFVEPV